MLVRVTAILMLLALAPQAAACPWHSLGMDEAAWADGEPPRRFSPFAEARLRHYATDPRLSSPPEAPPPEAKRDSSPSARAAKEAEPPAPVQTAPPWRAAEIAP